MVILLIRIFNSRKGIYYDTIRKLIESTGRTGEQVHKRTDTQPLESRSRNVSVFLLGDADGRNVVMPFLVFYVLLHF